MSLFDRLAFSIPAFSVTPVYTRTNRVLEVARIFTKHSKCCDKFFVLTMSLYVFRAYFATVYAVITVGLHAVEIFHCTTRFINQISKEVPYEAFSIRYHFRKIVHENTFALTLPCFIWVSRAIAKHARIVITAFMSMFKLRCKRHYRNLATYSWCTTWREHVTKTAPARRRHSVWGGGGCAQLYVIGSIQLQILESA